MNAHTVEDSELREFLARCDGQIRDQGCVILWTPFDRTKRAPAFAYTVGLTERFCKPELLVFGFSHDESLVLLSTLVRQFLRPGFAVPVNEPISHVLAEVPIVVKTIVPLRAQPYARLALARCVHRRIKFEIQQVVVPDPRGHFPWENGFDKRWERMQPLLFEAQ